jgi:hypothetical protein
MKNIIFISGITISFILIYQIISTIVTVSTNNNIKEIAKEDIAKAKVHMRLASESMTDESNFRQNIDKAEEIVKNVLEKKIFLNDIEVIKQNINILKKQFNKIETFDSQHATPLYE